MAVNEPVWSYGESKLFNSTGAVTDPNDAWVYGENHLLHEYVAAGGVAPTGTLYGPLVGALGGPV